MKTSVYADDAKNHFLKCFYLGMCPDLPRYPDNKVEQATLFLYSPKICFAQSTFGFPRSAFAKNNFAIDNCCKRYLINMP